MTVNKAVAMRVTQLLTEKNMTQYRLERKSGILHGTMACIMGERNKTITLNTLYLIAYGFDMTIQEFLDHELFHYENIDID